MPADFGLYLSSLASGKLPELSFKPATEYYLISSLHRSFSDEGSMIEWLPFFPQTTHSQIEQFERENGICLPPHYRAFLLSSNGGKAREPMVFKIPEIQAEVLLGALYGITDQEHGLSLETAFVDLKDRIPAEFIPIGEDPGGNLLLLAVTGDNTDGIYFWDRIGFLFRRTGKRLFRVAPDIFAFAESLVYSPP